MKVSKSADGYMEDLRVGQKFTTGKHVVDAAQIKRFANEFDPQPFHIDEDEAERSFFQGLAASGWHTAALTMRLIVSEGIPISWGIIGASAEMTWSRPLRPGDEIQVTTEIIEIVPSRSKPDRGIVTVESETRNQNDEVIQIMKIKLIVPRRQQI